VLFGSLPDGVEPVLIPRGGFDFTAYINRQNKKIGFIDPRIGELPPKWTAQLDPENRRFQRFKHDDSQKCANLDPRITPEARGQEGFR
jgi:hypothetical protein